MLTGRTQDGGGDISAEELVSFLSGKPVKMVKAARRKAAAAGRRTDAERADQGGQHHNPYHSL